MSGNPPLPAHPCDLQTKKKPRLCQNLISAGLLKNSNFLQFSIESTGKFYDRTYNLCALIMYREEDPIRSYENYNDV